MPKNAEENIAVYDRVISSLELENQTTWHGMIIEKLNDKKNNITWGYTLTAKDYEELIQWAIDKNDKAVLSALLSNEISHPFEETLKALLITAVKTNQNKNAEALLNHSVYLRENIDKFQGKGSMYKHGICGFTLLHLAALNGNVSLCKYLTGEFSNLSDIDDYYGNNCLHYAASSGNIECYEFFKSLNSNWHEKKNIFGHPPDAYLPEQISKITRAEQNHLIAKLNHYSTLKSQGNQASESLVGLCFGIAPITAIHILRGDDSVKEHEELQQAILSWDGTQEGLSRELNNTTINKMGIKTLDQAFNYLFNQYLFIFNMQKNEKSIIDFSKGDLSSQFAFINNKNDKLISEFDYGVDNISVDEFIDVINTNLKPNTIINIGVGKSGNNFFDNSGHQVSIVANHKGEIYFCDPDAPYKPNPLRKEDLKNVANIILKYYDNIKSIELFSYVPEKTLEFNASKDKFNFKENQAIFNSMLVNRNASDYKMMINSCVSDTPKTLRLILERVNNTNPSALRSEHIANLIKQSLKSNSYRCTEILIDEYSRRSNLSSEEVFKALDIPVNVASRFDNYMKNKP